MNTQIITGTIDDMAVKGDTGKFLDVMDEMNHKKAVQVSALSLSNMIDSLDQALIDLDNLQANFPESLEREDPEIRYDLNESFKALNRCQNCLQDTWNILNGME